MTLDALSRVASGHEESLQQADAVVHDACDDRQDDQARHHQRHVEDVLAVDDEVAEAGVGGEKLADNGADQRQADIYLEGGDDRRHRRREYDLAELLPLRCAERRHHDQLLWVGLPEGAVDRKDRDEQRDRDRQRDDGRHRGAQPDDKDRPQRHLRRGVEDDDVRIGHVAQEIRPPEHSGDQRCPATVPTPKPTSVSMTVIATW